jgi:hypothetical protein
MNKTFIYGICDGNKELLYIGKSNDVEKRFKQHMYGINNSNSIKYKNLGKHEQLIVFIIDEVSQYEWTMCEQFYVDYFKFIGCRLYNIMLMGSGSHIRYENNKESVIKSSPVLKIYNAHEIKNKLLELNIPLKSFLIKTGIGKYQFNEFANDMQQPSKVIIQRMNNTLRFLENKQIKIKEQIQKIINQL